MIKTGRHVSAHVEQKRECPQGTNTTSDRDTRRQTSQQSVTSGDGDEDDAVAGKRQWKKAVEERRRRCQQWRNCREEIECVHQDSG